MWTAISTRLYGNYLNNPALLAIPLAAAAGLALVRPATGAGRMGLAFAFSALLIAAVTLFGVVGLYPALLPSSLNPGWSMTIHNSASSPLTLKIMLVVALIFLPVVIAYQAWVCKTFSRKITAADLESEEAY